MNVQSSVARLTEGSVAVSRNAYTLAQLAAGTALVFFGLDVMLGWWLHVAAMVQLFSGSVAVGFNSGLCFALIGSTILVAFFSRDRARMVKALVGGLIVVLTTLILIEHFWDVDLGVDQPNLHRWINDGNPRPGRMAPNTAIALMFVGAALLSMRYLPLRYARRVVPTLIGLVAVIGVSGVVGYLLNFEALYRWYQFNRMALPTALSLTVVSFGLWTLRRGAVWYGETTRRPDEYIVFVASVLFVSIALIAGMTVFVTLQKGNEAILADSLRQTLNHRTDLFQSEIEQGEAILVSVATRPSLISAAQRLKANARDPAAHRAFDNAVQSLGLLRLSALAVYDAQGHELARRGEFVADPELRLPLRGYDGHLLWKGVYYMNVRAPLMQGAQTVGRVVIETALAGANKLLRDDRRVGDSEEMLVCGPNAEKIICFPTQVTPKAIVLAHYNSQGRRFPISRALAGESGVSTVISDYQRRNVIAAYGPIGALGLGMVVKIDSSEFYSDIRSQIQNVLPLLLAVVIGGTLVMSARLKPLTARLVESERKAIEGAQLVEEKERRLRAIVDNVAEAIVSIDERGIIQSFNPSAAGMFGYRPDEVIGSDVRMLMPESLRTSHEEGMRRYLTTGEQQLIGRGWVEMPGLCKDGTVMALEISLAEIRLDGHRSFVGMMRDITERKAAQERLEHMAQHDALTDLPNRPLFYDRLRQAMARARRNKQLVALMYLDIDHFKEINDRLGHDAGDVLLRDFAIRLRGAVRAVDTVARLGGDEFTVIAEALNRPDDGKTVAEKILRHMQEPFRIGNQPLPITVSIGVAFYHGIEIDADTLIKSADSALYRAKAAGRARYAIADGFASATPVARP